MKTAIFDDEPVIDAAGPGPRTGNGPGVFVREMTPLQARSE
ncbi:hypothetical protein [Yoonia algicola]|uniref:Uncharacterized protein n=1 Tax=Yoonia algicola TaxID=3137368 RepID=A0AAN0M5E6_9RHOB